LSFDTILQDTREA